LKGNLDLFAGEVGGSVQQLEVRMVEQKTRKIQLAVLQYYIWEGRIGFFTLTVSKVVANPAWFHCQGLARGIFP